MNHERYNQRLDFVKSLLQLNDLHAKSIEPVEYDINSAFPYNNFIYRVTLSSPTIATAKIKSFHSHKCQPGTAPCPAGTVSLIVRLANSHPGTGINNTNRVENEVAAMSLARHALAESKYSHLVPEIYAWGSVSSGQGFSIQQHMSGTMPDKGFDNLTLQDKSAVLRQMAEILALLQRYEIPATVDGFGGLKFDEDGTIVSAQMSLYKGGPCATYKDFLRAIFKVKLQEADENPVIQGWRENGLRTRLDDFIHHRLDAILKDNEHVQKVLVHSDLSTNNLLFNAATLQITALLDFDFSIVATKADEFMVYSFGNIAGGQLPGLYETGPLLELRDAMLAGFSKFTPVENCSEVQWDVAKAWDQELARAGAARPHTIRGFEEIADIYWLQDKISPFVLDNPSMRERKTAEQLKAVREETESLIVRFLDHGATASNGVSNE